LVQKLRHVYNQDPGLDGCLLELEEILKLKQGIGFTAARVVLSDNRWTSSSSVTIPTRKCTIWSYDEVDKVLIQKIHEDNSKWNLIELCSGFDVLDVVLAHAIEESPTIYGIQITRSRDPFRKHHTIQTCSDNSKKRLENLWNAIQNHIGIQGPNIFFTMIAPNCEDNKFEPPAGHVEPYFFSPYNLIFRQLAGGMCQPVPKRAKLATT
jgi:hypothetical protein